MRKVNTGVMLIAFLFLIGPLMAAGSGRNPDISERLGNDDYLVYSAVIRAHVVAQERALPVWIVNTIRPEFLDSFFDLKPTSTSVFETTYRTLTQSERFDYLKQRFPSLLQSTVDDYLSKNTRAAPLLRKLRLPVDYRLVNVETERELHRALYGKNKISELVTLSRAGFNKEKNQALVFMSTSGGTDGANTYFLLKRTRSRWDTIEDFECR